MTRFEGSRESGEGMAVVLDVPAELVEGRRGFDIVEKGERGAEDCSEVV